MSNALEGVLQRDKLIVLAALSAAAVLAWAYIAWLAHGMSSTGAMGDAMAPMSMPWTQADFVFTFVMWTVMMVGMMTPSVAPMILLYARVGRQAASHGAPLAATGWFAAGYFLAWTLFALIAAGAQGALQRAALLTPMLSSASAAVGGVILVSAGVLQWTPLKDACLRQCQAPMQFIQSHGGFRADALGSLRIGFLHGGYCIGCCWALMALLFVGGIMNVLWIAGLAIIVLLEKSIPGRWLPRLTGTALIGLGLWMLAGQPLPI